MPQSVENGFGEVYGVGVSTAASSVVKHIAARVLRRSWSGLPCWALCSLLMRRS